MQICTCIFACIGACLHARETRREKGNTNKVQAFFNMENESLARSASKNLFYIQFNF